MRQSLVGGWEIWKNMTMPDLPSLSKWRLIPRRTLEQARARRAFQDMAIKAPSAAAPVAALSGGNAQKVVFAKWAYGNAQVFLLDEPTAGVDVGTKAASSSQLRRRGRAPLRLHPSSSCSRSVTGSQSSGADAWSRAAGGGDGRARWSQPRSRMNATRRSAFTLFAPDLLSRCGCTARRRLRADPARAQAPAHHCTRPAWVPDVDQRHERVRPGLARRLHGDLHDGGALISETSTCRWRPRLRSRGCADERWPWASGRGAAALAAGAAYGVTNGQPCKLGVNAFIVTLGALTAIHRPHRLNSRSVCSRLRDAAQLPVRALALPTWAPSPPRPFLVAVTRPAHQHGARTQRCRLSINDLRARRLAPRSPRSHC